MRCVAQDAEARSLEALTIWQCKRNKARGLTASEGHGTSLARERVLVVQGADGPRSLRLQLQSSPSQGSGLQEALILRKPEGRVTLNSPAAEKV